MTQKNKLSCTLEYLDEIKEKIDALKHGSNTIECDVKDALEQAENISDFEEIVRGRMKELIDEAQGVITDFCGDVGVSPVSSENSFAQILCEVKRTLTDAGFRYLGQLQTMPGTVDEMHRFIRNKEEVIDIINDFPDEESIEAILAGDEE